MERRLEELNETVSFLLDKIDGITSQDKLDIIYHFDLADDENKVLGMMMLYDYTTNIENEGPKLCLKG